MSSRLRLVVHQAEYAVPTSSSGPASIITGPDGNLWFTEADAGQVQSLNPSGQFLRTYSVNGSPVGITVGSPVGADGAFWFAEQSGYIGRLTLSGNLTQYAVPSGATSQPTNIVLGSDNHIWFTEFRASQIGEANTMFKQFKQFTINTPNSVPVGITKGPDGKLWFAEAKGNKIGRISTSGRITEYKIPTVASGAEGITTGPDGALWFTEYNGGANKIGRISTSGKITEYALPTAFSGPWSIAAGSDGALWFTEQSGNEIGRITTAGQVTEFTFPNSTSGPFEITSGSDGNLWFTELTANKIGRVFP